MRRKVPWFSVPTRPRWRVFLVPSIEDEAGCEVDDEARHEWLMVRDWRRRIAAVAAEMQAVARVQR